jgi:hypothetical protein
MTNPILTQEEENLVKQGSSLGAGWTQPSIPLGEYPTVESETTESGHTFIKDDTPGNETISTMHRTGTFTTMYPDGSMANRIVGDDYEIIEKNKNVSIKGACQVTIYGDVNVEIKGNKYERIQGDFLQEIQGNYNQLVLGESVTTVNKDMDISVGSTAGILRIMAGSHVDITSDLDVDGAIAGESIMSHNEVTAGTGIHAGLPGSTNPVAGISTLGGIAAGFPAAPPVPGMIEATLSVNAPLISGIVVTDIRGPMELIRLLYDIHYHIGNRGFPTSMPIPLM